MNVGNHDRIRQVTGELVQRGVYGAELGEMIADRAGRQLSLTGLYDQLPDPENRIVPSASRTRSARHGPEITDRIDDYVRVADASGAGGGFRCIVR